MRTHLHPYLSFDGNCAEAFHFYNQVIASGAGRIAIRTHAGAPVPYQGDPAWADKVLHAHFEFEDLILFGSDIPPQHRVAPNAMVNLSVHVGQAGRAQEVFTALSEAGEVFMPFQKTFWAEGFGMLRDRYGFSWMVSVDHAR